jgi:hypothetical protein
MSASPISSRLRPNSHSTESRTSLERACSCEALGQSRVSATGGEDMHESEWRDWVRQYLRGLEAQIAALRSLEARVAGLEGKRLGYEARLRVGRPWEAEGESISVVPKAEVGGPTMTALCALRVDDDPRAIPRCSRRWRRSGRAMGAAVSKRRDGGGADRSFSLLLAPRFTDQPASSLRWSGMPVWPALRSSSRPSNTFLPPSLAEGPSGLQGVLSDLEALLTGAFGGCP